MPSGLESLEIEANEFEYACHGSYSPRQPARILAAATAGLSSRLVVPEWAESTILSLAVRILSLFHEPGKLRFGIFQINERYPRIWAERNLNCAEDSCKAFKPVLTLGFMC
jgi:hypothetical protein